MIVAILASPRPVRCVANFAASAAFMIFQACHERLVTTSSVLMQHNASFGINGEQPNIESYVKFVRAEIDALVVAQAKRIGITQSQMNEKTANDWWLTSGQSVDEKVADRLVQVSCTSDATTQTFEQMVNTMFGSVKLTWSRCPLAGYPVKIELPSMGANPSNKVLLDRDFIFRRSGGDGSLSQRIKNLNRWN